MPGVTSKLAVRVLVCVVLLGVTAWSLLIEGLNTTSAVVQIATFVVGLVAWVWAGRSPVIPPTPTGHTIQGVRSSRGNVKLAQSADTASARDIDADGDVDIRQGTGTP